MEKASIRFYEVKKCGLYKPNARHASLGSFLAITDNIFNWSHAANRLVQSTCTYEVDGDFEMDFLETYLASIKKDNSSGDFILTTWNRTHDSGDSVYALDPSATVDSITSNTFHRGNLPATSIPGYATYFWLMPSLNTMATITFGSPRSGMSPFSYWLESFINVESRYCRRSDSGDEILGYAEADNPPDSELEARFIRVLHKNPAKRQMIIANRSRIKRIIKRVKLDRAQIVHSGAIDNLAKLLGIDRHPEITSSELPLTYELGYTPTEEQLEEIISAYENSNTKTNWEDVGFVFPKKNSFGANEKEWLSKSFAKTNINLQVDWVVPGQLINTQNLLEIIQQRRSELVRILNS